MRPPGWLIQHKEKAEQRCSAFAIFTASTDNSAVKLSRTRSMCKSYLCERCRPANYKFFRKKILRALDKTNYTFWTFSTTKPSEVTPEFIETLQAGWRGFWNALRKHYPKLKYIKVLEISEHGQPHFHVIFSGYADFTIVNSLWKLHTGGCHTQFQRIDSHRVGYYMTKYITKAAHGNHTFEEAIAVSGVHRFASSRFLLTNPPKLYAPLAAAKSQSKDTDVAFTNFLETIFQDFCSPRDSIYRIDNNNFIIWKEQQQ